MDLDYLKRTISGYLMPGGALGTTQYAAANATNGNEVFTEGALKAGEAATEGIPIASTDIVSPVINHSGLVLVNGEFFFYGVNLVHLGSVVVSIVTLLAMIYKFIDDRRTARRERDTYRLALEDAMLLRDFQPDEDFPKKKK